MSMEKKMKFLEFVTLLNFGSRKEIQKWKFENDWVEENIEGVEFACVDGTIIVEYGYKLYVDPRHTFFLEDYVKLGDGWVFYNWLRNGKKNLLEQLEQIIFDGAVAVNPQAV